MIVEKDLYAFIDEVLSLSFNVRKDLISLAEDHYSNIPFGSKDIYNYLYWRCKMIPRDHKMAIDLP